MKKYPTGSISVVKQGKVVKKSKSSRNVRLRAHGSLAANNVTPKYADGLIRIYKQEEEDIERFAAFAKTLIHR